MAGGDGPRLAEMLHCQPASGCPAPWSWPTYAPARVLGARAYHHSIPGTLATMLPMLPATCRWARSAPPTSAGADAGRVPDLDAMIDGLAQPVRRSGGRTARGLPRAASGSTGRLTYPGGGGRAEGLTWSCPPATRLLLSAQRRRQDHAGHPAGPAAGADRGGDHRGRRADRSRARAWQRKVAVVYQDFARYRSVPPRTSAVRRPPA